MGVHYHAHYYPLFLLRITHKKATFFARAKGRPILPRNLSDFCWDNVTSNSVTRCLLVGVLPSRPLRDTLEVVSLYKGCR
jgi:hypothetical protein